MKLLHSTYVLNSKKGFDFRPARRNEKFLCEFEQIFSKLWSKFKKGIFCVKWKLDLKNPWFELQNVSTQNLIVEKSKSYLDKKKTCKIDSMGSFSVKKWSYEKKCHLQICERSKFILWKVKLVKIDSHWEVVLWNFYVSKFLEKSLRSANPGTPKPGT